MDIDKSGENPDEISLEIPSTTQKGINNPKNPLSSDDLSKASKDKLNHEQVYALITGNEIGWQAIIYDLINTEQLDPLDLNITALAQRYLEVVRQLEEANFFVSSNVILAASLLLRIKSDYLLERYIKSIDEILFGTKSEETKKLERIEINEDELPLIYPRSPLPRHKKVTLQELMTALNKAIKTENRRIKKEIIIHRARMETDIVMPKAGINIKDRIKQVYTRILGRFSTNKERIPYSAVSGESKEDRIASFLPVLHLDTQKRVFLEQQQHFDEIYIWVYKHYLENIDLFKKEEDRLLEEVEKEEEISEETGFDNPLGEMLSE